MATAAALDWIIGRGIWKPHVRQAAAVLLAHGFLFRSFICSADRPLNQCARAETLDFVSQGGRRESSRGWPGWAVMQGERGGAAAWPSMVCCTGTFATFSGSLHASAALV